MSMTAKKAQTFASSAIPKLPHDTATGLVNFKGTILMVAPADPSYGADEGTRVALVCNQADAQIVPVALSAHQLPDLEVGTCVEVSGDYEPLIASDAAEGAVAFTIVAAYDIHEKIGRSLGHPIP